MQSDRTFFLSTFIVALSLVFVVNGIFVSDTRAALPPTTWTGGAGDWFDPTMWSAGVPAGGQSAQSAAVPAGGNPMVSSGSGGAGPLKVDGTITQTGGTIITQSTTLGDEVGSTGTYHESSSGVATLGITTVGNAGTGSVILDGGSISTTTPTLGQLAGSSGQLTVNGGLIYTGTLLTVGAAGSGSIVQSGGSIGASTSRSNLYVAYSPGSSGSFSMNAGSAFFQLAMFGLSGQNASFDQSGGQFSTSSSESFNQGATATISGGTHSVGGTMTVSNGAALTYSGGGISAQGFNTAGTLKFVVDPAAPLSPIQSAQTVGLNGTLDIDFNDTDALLLSPSDAFVLINTQPPLDMSGSFKNIANGSRLTSDGYSFLVSYGKGSPFGGNELVISDFQQVPEPAGILTLSGCMAAIVIRRGRHKYADSAM